MDRTDADKAKRFWIYAPLSNFHRTVKFLCGESWGGGGLTHFLIMFVLLSLSLTYTNTHLSIVIELCNRN